MCLLIGEKGSSLDTGIGTLKQNLYREPAVNWEKSSPKWKIICGSVCIEGEGGGEDGEEEKKKILLENFREQSGRKLRFFSNFSELSFSKTENFGSGRYL